jgi:O-succinylbenzoate synthase
MRHAFLAEKEQSRLELAQAEMRVEQVVSAAGADLEAQRARLRAEVESVAQANAADLLVLKAAPLGGVNNALRIAKEAGLPVVVSSALETSVGISMGVYLAALLDSEYASGLATAALLTEDVTDTPLTPINGEIPVTRISTDKNALTKLQAPTDRTEWWMERLERCLAS